MGILTGFANFLFPSFGIMGVRDNFLKSGDGDPRWQFLSADLVNDKGRNARININIQEGDDARTNDNAELATNPVCMKLPCSIAGDVFDYRG